ncbi:MAG: hypothetical protein HY290_22495 [Planctomycetia bacterium]|nr:hypothetical protein [Planctomycetia bacterium]
MKRIVLSLTLAAMCGIAALFAAPATTQARDPYWDNHWQWHNRTYRPYYYRYYGPSYYYSAPPVYNGYYGGGYYNGGYYAPGTTYYAPAPGYYGGGVQVGPLQFGWW